MESMAVYLPARLLTVGQLVAHANWIHPARRLDSSVLILTVSGSFGIRVGEAPHVLGPEQALILPAGLPHRGFALREDRPPVYYWAHFVNAAQGARDRVEVAGCSDRLSEDTYNRAVALFHQLISEKSAGIPVACDYLLSLLFLELGAANTRGDPGKALFNRLSEYIRLHCHERLTLSVLSGALGYSEDYLSRIFHAHTNESFREYIHRLRLQRARQELLSTVKSVQEIALDCGYPNAKFFSTSFLKYEGITPTVYRNMYGAIHQNTD